MHASWEILKVLSDPTRVRLLALLLNEELSVAELQEILGMAQSRISSQLALLRSAELVVDRRDGKRAYYSLRPALAPATFALLQSATEAVADLPPVEAHAAMTALHGIGPWTADIFLLFCAGHPDIWPGGDLALQAAVMEAFGLDTRPGEKLCRAIADDWAPWRSVAARLFWAYYKVCRDGRSSLPV